MLMSASDRYVRLRAPAEDGQTLAIPPLDGIDDLLTSNRQHRITCDCLGEDSIHGRSIARLAGEARRQLLSAALDFTRTYSDPSALQVKSQSQGKSPSPDPSQGRGPGRGISSDTLSDGPLILTGHQPELVHPGVWLKNFTAERLAAEHGGMAINLIIDSDLCRAPSIKVPVGTPWSPRIDRVPYDRPSHEIPLEERSWGDSAVWDSFGKRVHEKISPLVADSMVQEWWAEVSSLAGDAPTLGLGLARARHLTELAWLRTSQRPSHSLELPQSQVCQLPAFRWLLAHVLAQMPRFRNAHNDALADYRQAHRLRNHAQPVPDLADVDGWLEAPFWIWSTRDPQRRGLFVRHCHDGLRLTDRHGFTETLPITDDGPADDAVTCLAEWESRGVKLRTRAMLTTLFARLLLADLFIHGIGGAKYDQVTDAISTRFFGFAPPAYLTLSGTLRLLQSTGFQSPGPCEADRPTAVAQTLRELRYHPEQHLDLSAMDASMRNEAQGIIQKKLSSIHLPKTHENGAMRHRSITSANTALQPWLASKREALERELIEAEQQIRANRILQSREYAFCLFPAERLRQFFAR